MLLKEPEGQVLVHLTEKGVPDDVGDENRAETAFLLHGPHCPFRFHYTVDRFVPPAKEEATIGL